MNGRHVKTLKAVFEDPVRSDVAWSAIERLLTALGSRISEGRGSRVRIELNGVRAVFHRPHPEKETDRGALKSVAFSGGGRHQAMMEYKSYLGRVEYDDEAEIFHGEVINTRDVITFQGSSVMELKKAFRDSVDDYLQWCAEQGTEPDKPYSGRFVLRLDPETHRNLATEAARRHLSLNGLILQKLEKSDGREDSAA